MLFGDSSLPEVKIGGDLGRIGEAAKDLRIGGDVGRLANKAKEELNNAFDALDDAWELTKHNFGVSAVLLQQSIALDSDTSRRTILFDPQTHTT